MPGWAWLLVGIVGGAIGVTVGGWLYIVTHWDWPG